MKQVWGVFSCNCLLSLLMWKLLVRRFKFNAKMHLINMHMNGSESIVFLNELVCRVYDSICIKCEVGGLGVSAWG